MLIENKKIETQNEFCNKDKNYYASALISFELRKDAEELSQVQLKELVELFWNLRVSIDKFALKYDGCKNLKLIIPIDHSDRTLLETGYALAEFKHAIEVFNLLEIEAIDTNIEDYDDNLRYFYMQ